MFGCFTKMPVKRKIILKCENPAEGFSMYFIKIKLEKYEYKILQNIEANLTEAPIDCIK